MKKELPVWSADIPVTLEQCNAGKDLRIMASNDYAGIEKEYPPIYKTSSLGRLVFKRLAHTSPQSSLS
jgi:hypothetical protein